MRKRTRVTLVAAAVALVLAGVVFALFVFGGPTAPGNAVAPQTGGAAPSGGMGAAMAGAADDDRFIIEIPGCTCHSTDPEVVAAHASYRMSECAQCH